MGTSAFRPENEASYQNTLNKDFKNREVNKNMPNKNILHM
jgi:hypothetical protein